MDTRFSKKLRYSLIGLVVFAAFLGGVVLTKSFDSDGKLVLLPSATVSSSPTISLQSPTPSVSSSDVEEDFSENITFAPFPSGLEKPQVTASGNSVLGSSTRQKAKVIRVVDGDTIQIEGGQTIRYIGVDTPETVKPNTPVQCFGKEASAKNKELVEGKEIELEKDISETDRYGRLLRYVYVSNTFVNHYLVREGFAYSSSYPPDVKYQEFFKIAQQEAEKESKGLWGSCTQATKKAESSGAVLAATANENSSQPAASTASVSSVSSTAGGGQGCTIKGNISTSGKIYHLPGCGSYDKTTINASQGERMFCTEKEAEEAGWRKAKNC